MVVDPTTVFAADAGDKEASALEVVVVTAQRREESLQRAALAVTAVTGQALVNAGVTDTSQLTAIAPALQVSTVFGPSNNFYMREDNQAALNFNHQFASFYEQFKTETDSYAAFGRLAFSITDELRLSAGARYTVDRKTADIFHVATVVICPAQLAAPVFPPNTLRCENGQAVMPHTIDPPAFGLQEHTLEMMA